MKKVKLALAFVSIAFTILSCGNSNNEVVHQKTDSVDVVTEEVFVQPDTVLFYSVREETKEKVRVFDDTISITEPVSVINGINSVYPDIKLRYLKTSQDTVYAHIDNADVFASDMGSSGAREYIAAVVLNLTTLNNIEYVNLDFKQGSHASPGVYSQKEFEGYTEKK